MTFRHDLFLLFNYPDNLTDKATISKFPDNFLKYPDTSSGYNHPDNLTDDLENQELDNYSGYSDANG